MNETLVQDKKQMFVLPFQSVLSLPLERRDCCMPRNDRCLMLVPCGNTGTPSPHHQYPKQAQETGRHHQQQQQLTTTTTTKM